MPPENVQVMEVEAEHITVRVGNLTIETPPAQPGRIVHPYMTKVLFDGKPAPISISRIELTCGVDEAWVVKLTGFVYG